jgi:hypothetical protein
VATPTVATPTVVTVAIPTVVTVAIPTVATPTLAMGCRLPHIRLQVRLHGLPHDSAQRGQQLAAREPMLPLQLRDLLKSHLQVRCKG